MTQQPEALRLADLLESCPLAVGDAQHKQRQDQRVLELNAQRDALLEALKEVLAWGTDQNYVRAEAACDKARAAIKAVEEGN